MTWPRVEFPLAVAASQLLRLCSWGICHCCRFCVVGSGCSQCGRQSGEEIWGAAAADGGEDGRDDEWWVFPLGWMDGLPELTVPPTHPHTHPAHTLTHKERERDSYFPSVAQSTCLHTRTNMRTPTYPSLVTHTYLLNPPNQTHDRTHLVHQSALTHTHAINGSITLTITRTLPLTPSCTGIHSHSVCSLPFMDRLHLLHPARGPAGGSQETGRGGSFRLLDHREYRHLRGMTRFCGVEDRGFPNIPTLP